MKQEQAIIYLQHFLVFAQKTRSIMAESSSNSLGLLFEDVDFTLNKWLSKNSPFFIIAKLEKILESCENGNELEPQVFYNMMYIADMFIPQIHFILDYDLPKPNNEWLKGWR